MLKDNLNKLEALLKNAQLSDDKRAELNRLTAELKTELEALAHKDRETAESIAGFTHVATHEALRQRKNPELTAISQQGLQASVDSFELSHPRLFTAINAFVTSLSGIGV
jgi:hypothetical protein